MSDNNNNSKQQYGVVLYYKYTTITNLDDLVAFYESNCTSLGLLGRVRLAPHGVNVTIGGKLSDVEKHISAVKENSLFDGTDFKLASCHQPLDDKVALECGFTSLSVRKVKELVTFSCHPLLNSPEVGNAGSHLSAAEFHSVLQSAAQHADQGVQADSKNIVLLDARNVYETRIGKFDTPNVETLDPGIRQYSDLPAWIDNNCERLQGKQILMYCTGGIRCEVASAYIKSKGAGFENVFQLYGGIQRYLEQFPDGGFFKGKNFVFDHRISVGSSDISVLGTCLLCGLTFDDYSPRCRCSHCRMLVLVCDGCRMNHEIYVCELCQKHSKGLGYVLPIENGDSKEKHQRRGINTVSNCSRISSQLCGTQGPPRKLRILCLHGFRQNASNFKGRTASLAKKLKNFAELVFIDAPHELPFIYQACMTEPIQSSLSPVQELGNPPPQNCKKRFAWLVPPGFNRECVDDWKTADGPFDPLQYQQQTEGFEASLAFLKSIFSDNGPFDGILGFSQGAAMTALVSTHKERLKGEIDFRFVILCSGFAVNLTTIQHGTINCPSLHIFGGHQGKDRQIANEASKQLASLYEEGSSVIIEHECGHIIPTRSPYIDEIKTFLRRFL